MSHDKYEWLATQKPNSLSLEMNEHACNYVTAKRWIEDYNSEQFECVAPELITEMKNSNTIWRLQIYPSTPVGFSFWYGPTLDSVLEQAMRDTRGIDAS